MTRFEVIPHKVWRHVTGRTVSIYGSIPWTCEADKANWSVEEKGFTIRDNNSGKVGGYAGLDRMRKFGRADLHHVTKLAEMLESKLGV